MDNSTERILHTGLFSANAAEIFKNFFKYSHDAASTRRLRRAFSRLKVDIAPDGEVLIATVLAGGKDKNGNACYGTSFWDHTTAEKSKVWIAVRMKQHVIEIARSDGAWRRNNDALVKGLAPDLAVTVSEFYLIYDVLLNRSKLEKKYDADTYARVIGTKRDPLIAQMEINRRAEVERINEEFKLAKKAAADKRRRLYDEYYTKLRADEAAEVEAAQKKRDDELAAIEDAMKTVLAANELGNDLNGSVSNSVQY